MEPLVKNLIMLEVIKSCSKKGDEEFNASRLEEIKGFDREQFVKQKIRLVVDIIKSIDKEII